MRTLALAAIGLASACSLGPVDLAGKHCPCAPGWTCDEATRTCVQGVTIADGGTDASAADSGLDASDPDAGADPDAGLSDAGPPDAGPSDAGPTEPTEKCVEPGPLVGYWSFDATSGSSVLDQSGNGHHGGLVAGAAVVSDGRVGSALELSGTDQHVAVASDSQLAEPGSWFSLAAWVRTTADGYVIFHGNGQGDGNHDKIYLRVTGGQAAFAFATGSSIVEVVGDDRVDDGE